MKSNFTSSSGSGIGTFLLAPAVQMLIEYYSWRGALLILGGFVSNLCVCGALMRPLEPKGDERSVLHYFAYLSINLIFFLNVTSATNKCNFYIHHELKFESLLNLKTIKNIITCSLPVWEQIVSQHLTLQTGLSVLRQIADLLKVWTAEPAGWCFTHIVFVLANRGG